MQNINPLLGGISLRTFLQEYWQQKPLLIRNAIPDYLCPISADEMAGLACESEVESRIILEKGEHDWECLQGPFAEDQFSQLPETLWTLLIQSCNLYLPEFALLLERFRFIPNWRVDDIMVSYAAPGGSVGPHIDNYDVFLLQAQGKRQWSISTQRYSDEDLIAGIDLKIIKSFKREENWVLAPGDMLYLPPGVAHHGVACEHEEDPDTECKSQHENCITVSIGFRAPNVSELSTALLDEVLSTEFEVQQAEVFTKSIDSIFYEDPKIPPQENSGEITDWALQRIKSLVHQQLSQVMDDKDWFGKYITRVSDEVEAKLLEINPAQCKSMLSQEHQLVRNEYSKLSFSFFPNSSVGGQDKIHFYCNGEVTVYSASLKVLIKTVCNSRYPSSALLVNELSDDVATNFLAVLVSQGHFVFESEFDDK